MQNEMSRQLHSALWNLKSSKYQNRVIILYLNQRSTSEMFCVTLKNPKEGARQSSEYLRRLFETRSEKWSYKIMIT